MQLSSSQEDFNLIIADFKARVELQKIINFNKDNMEAQVVIDKMWALEQKAEVICLEIINTNIKAIGEQDLKSLRGIVYIKDLEANGLVFRHKEFRWLTENGILLMISKISYDGVELKHEIFKVKMDSNLLFSIKNQ